jgi:outer membrane immunogenic protein
MDSENSRSVHFGVTFAAIATAMCPFVAVAADLPQPMYTKAPPAIAAATPYRWAGLYIGGHLGYLWGRTSVEDDGVTTKHNARTDGIVGGAMLGYNWQIDRVVFGLEGDFGWTNAHGVGATVLIPVTTRGPNNYDVRWTSHIRGRVGYALDNWLIFAAGGFAAADLSFHEGAINKTFVLMPGGGGAGGGDGGSGGVGGGGGSTAGGGGAGGGGSGAGSDSDGGKYYGWSVGGGIEHAFTSNLVGRVEYFYDHYGHKDYVGVLGDRYRVSLTGQTVRAALAWKFDPFGR